MQSWRFGRWPDRVLEAAWLCNSRLRKGTEEELLWALGSSQHRTERGLSLQVTQLGWRQLLFGVHYLLGIKEHSEGCPSCNGHWGSLNPTSLRIPAVFLLLSTFYYLKCKTLSSCDDQAPESQE